MRELTNGDFTDIKLYYIFHFEYKDIELHISKKNTNNHMPDARFAGAASLSFQYGGFVNKANTPQPLAFY